MVRISSNVAALTSQRVMGQTQKSVERSLMELASGNRYVDAGVDPAGHAISEGIQSQIKGYSAARRNADNAVSFIQIAEGALNEQNNILIRMRELAIQAASDTFSDTERGFLNKEFEQINQELDRIAKTTRFGSQQLLDGTTKEYEFQVGVNKGDDNIIRYVNNTNTTASELGVDGLNIEDKGDARDSLETIDEALVAISGARAQMGAIQNRMDNAVNHIDSQVESLAQAYSKMADTDVAQAVASARRGQILQQYQASALAMALDNDQSLLKLVA